MTRLGIYIIHNNRYKLVKTVNVPWDFAISGPDDNNPIVDKPIIGEWDPMKYILRPDNIAYEDENQIIVKERIVLAPSEQKEITKLYRVTYNKVGIFEAVRKYMTAEEWTDFLNNENVNWLYKPDYYESSYISYFTDAGFEQFKEKTLPLILDILQEENIRTNVLEVAREIEVEDSDEVTPMMLNSDVPAGFEEIPFDCECGDDDNNNEEEEKPTNFEDWVTNYFYNVIFEEKDFFIGLNTNRVYFIIAEEDPTIMGFMITYKGRTVINFEEHDYRNIINAMHPEIRKEMKDLPDESFGGHDEDKDFSFEGIKPDSSFGGYDSDEGFIFKDKGVDTYPNLNI